MKNEIRNIQSIHLGCAAGIFTSTIEGSVKVLVNNLQMFIWILAEVSLPP